MSMLAAGPEGQERDRSGTGGTEQGGGRAERDTSTLEVRKALREGRMGRK